MHSTRGPHAPTLGAAGWLLLAAAWCVTLPLRPLFDPDEGRYAEIPREMLASGDWVTPHLNGLLYFEKPPLQYWATALAYRVFGVHPWSSRLWAAGLAFLCLPLAAAWARRFCGETAALAAVTALAVSPFFVPLGHLNLLDQGFTFFLCAAVLGFAAVQTLTGGAQRRLLLLVWASAALAVLSKGIVVFVLCGATLLAYSAVTRDLRPWRRLAPQYGLPLLLLLTLPWFVLISGRHPSFPGFFFVHEHLARFLTTVHQRVEPWWYFLPLLLLAVLPWLSALSRGARAAWNEPPAAEFRPRLFLGLFAACTLLFFSASGSKLAPYILPLLPPLAVLAAASVRDAAAFARGAARVGLLLVGMVVAAGLAWSARRNSYVPHTAVLWCAAALLAALAAVILTWSRGRAARTATLAAALGGVLAWQCLLCAYGAIPPARSARDLAAAVGPFVGAQTRLYSVGQYRETLSPYLGRTLQLVDFEGELQFGLTQEPQQRMTVQQFIERWRREPGAIAFVDPRRWEALRRAGMTGEVLAADDDTAAVRAP